MGGTTTSGSRTNGVRYINDLVAKSPSKSGKLGNSRKAQYQQSNTVKKTLDQSITSLNSGKGANNQTQEGTTRKLKKQNADLMMDDQPVVVEDLKYENSYDHLSPLKTKVDVSDPNYNMNNFNVTNMA